MSFDLALINNDLKVNPNGAVRTVSDTPKLKQDIVKIILTPLGSVEAHPWYGCPINEDLVGKVLPRNMMQEQARVSVEIALNRLKDLQRAQSAGQAVSLAELIQVVAEVTVRNDIEDPRLFILTATVLAKDLSQVDEYFTISNT
jgi:hypothetical protein